ncbi:MAG TPA: T9SS type A sorting domain-containing protein [Chitinophagaceae bacterium]|nr:T9SS type A sorting domain-containing protein [Chitinophagaceae bacterium]
MIAYNLSPVGFRAWTATPVQKSVPVRLIKGARYYIEALHKQSSTANHLSVGWVLPNGIGERPIPGNRLSPWVPGTITQARKSNFENAMKVKTETELNQSLTATASPNPSPGYFEVSIKSNSIESILITVTDITGRVIERKPNIKANSIIQLGNKYNKGIYFVEVSQGEKKEKLKIVKM